MVAVGRITVDQLLNGPPPAPRDPVDALRVAWADPRRRRMVAELLRALTRAQRT
jgi:hypothetical protein